MNRNSIAPAPSVADAPTWVLINGWGSHSSLWQDFLASHTGPVMLLDVSLTESDPLLTDGQSWLDWVNAACSRVPHNSVLIGWSLGAMLATQIAARVPERVRALITLACNPCFVARPDWSEAMAPEVFNQFCADFAAQPDKTWTRFCGLQAQGDVARKEVAYRLKQQEPPSASIAPIWQQQLSWLMQIDNSQLLARQLRENVSCPQLHLFGEMDGLVPATVAPELRTLLADSVGRLGLHEVQVLPGLGHAPHVSAPSQVAARVHSWLQSLQSISKNKIARSFAAAVDTYDAAAHVQRRVADQLMAWVPEFSAQATVVDLGCGTGFVAERLQWRAADRPSADQPNIILADLAPRMAACAQTKLPRLAALAADAEALPFADNSLDALVSSLALQWCSDLVRVGKEAQRCLRSGGMLVFSTLGPATLKELKQAWAEVDHYVHVNPFKSAEQVRAELSAAGLMVDTLCHQPFTLAYPQLLPLLRELKAIGAHNMNPGQARGLGRRRQLQRLEQAYDSLADQYGLLPVTYDVILVVAKKP
jgi:malonyl-CoA O-methyltransferase